MSIDKESDGLPGMNVHRPDTKINLGMVIGVIVFLLLGAIATFWMIKKTGGKNPEQGMEQR